MCCQVIPVKFIRTHGALLSTPELSMTGPNGCSLPVMLKVRPPLYGRAQCDDRVFLSHGWREFVKENGVQVGDRVVFYMVKRSTFRVLVCSHPKLKAVFENAMLIGILPKKEEDSGLDDNRTPENVVSSEAPPPLKVYHRLVKLETAVPKCETNLIPAKTPIQQWHCGSPDKATAVAVKTSPTLGAERFVKHPKVAAAISLGSTFPQFVRKLTKSSLSIDGNSDIRLVRLISCLHVRLYCWSSLVSRFPSSFHYMHKIRFILVWPRLHTDFWNPQSGKIHKIIENSV